MANEFTASITFQFLKNLAKVSAVLTTQATISGSVGCDLQKSIGTSYEALVFGSVGTPGYFMLQNLSTANYVEVTSDGGSTYPIKLAAGSSSDAGGICLIPNNSATWGVRANTAACVVSIRAVAP